MINTVSKGQSVNRTLAQTLQRLRKLFVRAEKGSMDGGNTSDIEYIPFLTALLLFGLMVALVGFYRVGASYSTQYAAQVGSVAPDQGNAALAAMWKAWTNSNDAPTDGFTQDSQTRSVNTSISASKSFNLGILGDYSFDIGSGTAIHVRSERFYPGAP
jgi:hypothetical protein